MRSVAHFSMGGTDVRKRQYVALRVDEALMNALKMEATRRGQDLSSTIRRLIKAGMEAKSDGGHTFRQAVESIYQE